MPMSQAHIQSRGEALPLATDANSIRRKAMKASVKSSNANAGQKAMALKQSKPRKLARFPKSPRKPPTRASNAAHTRSQGAFPDPPVRIQHPRLRTEEPRFGIHEGRFHCGALVEERMRVPLRLVAASLKESTIPGAGLGVFVREDVPKDKIFLEYGGECITLAEAKKRQQKVHIVYPSIVICVCWLKHPPQRRATTTSSASIRSPSTRSLPCVALTFGSPNVISSLDSPTPSTALSAIAGSSLSAIASSWNPQSRSSPAWR